MSQFKISKYSSLNFEDWKLDFEKDECYAQKFARGDDLIVQYEVISSRNISPILTDEYGNRTVIDPEFLSNRAVDGDIWLIYRFKLPLLDIGAYRLDFSNGYAVAKTCFFSVLDDEDLEDTVLFTYTHRRNEFDVFFTEDYTDFLSFDFRCEGGFLPSEYLYGIENESFRDQRFVNTQLDARPYRKKVLTLGNETGVPAWVGEKVNLLFSTTKVLINGEEHVRSEASTPTITTMMYLYPLYIYKMEVEEKDHYHTDLSIPVEVLATETEPANESEFILTEDDFMIIIETNGKY